MADILSVDNNQYLYIGAVVLLTAVIVYLGYRNFTRHSSICRLFRLPRVWTRILLTDLSGQTYPSLCIDNIYSKPDVVFKCGRTIVVGELKSGRKPRLRDYLQLVIYMGACKQRFRSKRIIGILAYRSELYRCEYDSTVYRQLLSLRESAKKVKQGKELRDRRNFYEFFCYSKVDFLQTRMIHLSASDYPI